MSLDPDRSSPRGTISRQEVIAILALVLVAAALRIVNFGWGLPLDPYTGYYHPDERKIIQGALAFPGDIFTRTDLRYPTAYHYAIGVASIPARWLTARAAPTVDPFLVTMVVGRALTLTLALATVLATWWLGRRWYGARGGLVAAAFVAVALVHVVHSGYATLDVPTSFLVVATLWACDRVVRAGRRRDVVLVGILAGLLIGTKYPGGVILVPALLAITLGHQRTRREAGWRAAPVARGFVADVALCLALAAGVTLLTTPGILLHPEHLRAAIVYEGGRQTFGETSWLEVEAWRDALDSLQVAVGPAAGLLLAAALALALYRPGFPEALLLAFIVPYYLVLGDRVANRYLVILVPLLALLVGRLAYLAAASPRRWLRLVTTGTLGLVWCAALWAAVVAVAFIHQPDVRSQAARYLAEHTPPGATVCLDQVNEDQAEAWKEPPIAADRHHLVGCGEMPGWVITIGGLGRVEQALASPYLRADYTWDPDQGDWWPDDEPTAPDRLRFYDALLPGTDDHTDYALSAEFTRPRLPTVPFDVSAVRVWQRRP